MSFEHFTIKVVCDKFVGHILWTLAIYQLYKFIKNFYRFIWGIWMNLLVQLCSAPFMHLSNSVIFKLLKMSLMCNRQQLYYFYSSSLFWLVQSWQMNVNVTLGRCSALPTTWTLQPSLWHTINLNINNLTKSVK